MNSVFFVQVVVHYSATKVLNNFLINVIIEKKNGYFLK